MSSGPSPDTNGLSVAEIDDVQNSQMFIVFVLTALLQPLMVRFRLSPQVMLRLVSFRLTAYV